MVITCSRLSKEFRPNTNKVQTLCLATRSLGSKPLGLTFVLYQVVVACLMEASVRATMFLHSSMNFSSSRWLRCWRYGRAGVPSSYLILLLRLESRFPFWRWGRMTFRLWTEWISLRSLRTFGPSSLSLPRRLYQIERALSIIWSFSLPNPVETTRFLAAILFELRWNEPENTSTISWWPPWERAPPSQSFGSVFPVPTRAFAQK